MGLMKIRMFVMVIASFGIAAVCAMGAQTTSSSDSRNWRDVPVPLHVHPDAASAENRKARDDYWARFFPLSKDGPYFGAKVGAVEDPRSPEIRQIPGSFWAIATFVNYDLQGVSADGVYTEIHFRIDRIVTPSASATPQEGETIDADLLGGTCQEPSGEIRQYKGSKAEWPSGLDPGGRFLIQFDYFPQGDFYAMVDYFDLSTGVARAASHRVRWLKENGKSHVDGLSEADVVAYIQRAASQK